MAPSDRDSSVARESAKQIKSRTTPGRLSALDSYAARYERDLLAQGTDEAVVDVGFGEWPWTTTEMAECFWSVNSKLQIVATETDPRRIKQASPCASSLLEFRLAVGSLKETVPESIRLIRAMNVLRGYPKADARIVLEEWGEALSEKGVLIEGTSDPEGDILTAHIFRKTDGILVQESLLFYTNFEHGFAPWMFRDHLPVDLRRDVRPGTWIHNLFTSWYEAWQIQRSSNLDIREVFSKSIEDILPRQDSWLTERGYALFSRK